ncbi:MAG: hypothetical protein U0M12_04390 [Acutalibacteraceae bacterium]|nr:hypothetical protein [Acutalibacteraceae bacterium]
MKNIKRKTVSVLLALSMLGAVATLTAYAEPIEGEGDVPVTDDGGTMDTPVVDTVDPPVDDTPVDDTPVNDTPVQDDVTTGDSSSNSGDEYVSGDSTVDNTDSTVTDNSDSTVNYDADYYYDMYNSGDYGTVYEEPQVTYDYDPGMSFDEFERATDYQSATASTENMVDMYNSNGSDSTTLSDADWADISLNFDNVSADGTGDFSFIKNNNSDKDSNLSVLFLIFGIIFVASSLAMITYLIVSGIRNRKLVNTNVSGATRGSSNIANDRRNKRKHHYASHQDSDNQHITHETSRTKFNYDTAEIDISKYDFDDEY